MAIEKIAPVSRIYPLGDQKRRPFEQQSNQNKEQAKDSFEKSLEEETKKFQNYSK